MPAELEFRFRTKTIVAGVWENVSLTYYCGPPTGKEVLDADKINDAVLAEFPSGYSLVAFVDAAQALPSAEVRKVASEIVKRREGQAKVSVVVLEGKGFWASAMRMAITGLAGFMSGKGNRRFAGSIEEAAPIVAPYTNRADGSPVTVDKLVSMLQSFREQC